ncbi:MAG TPA: rhomboid family intramembrane serine protease [Thermoleophilaceae bacterium]|nr:rhomboid family intramembrane serine protease [Thermoleophilaceae bacterium]
MSQPDLFVVCKNCGSEVSPYVTECPYCGQRVRKRAPKIDRSTGEPTQRRRRRGRKLPRLRADEIAGIAPDTRPYGTFALLVACLIAMLVDAAKSSGPDLGYLVVSDTLPQKFLGHDEVWRWFATPFLHGDQLGYAFVALVPVAIFGTLLERRFGLAAAVVTFILAGAAGAGLAATLETPPLLSDAPAWNVMGANGAALGLLCAWLVDDRLAARRGEDRENDLLGVYIIAAVLVLLSLTTIEANIGAAVGGALAGTLIGLILPRLPRRA